MDFTNKSINLLNLHSAIQRFSSNIFDTFGAIYLLSLGISFPIVALIWTSICILGIILRPLSLMLSEKIGLKRSLILGVFISSGLFLVLSKVNGVNSWLYFYILYLTLCDIAYWLPYNSFYAVAGDINSRGKQIGTKLGFVTLLRMVAPLSGGIIITHFGFFYLYVIAMVVMLLSVIPLFFVQDVSPGKLISFKEAIRSIDSRGMILQIGDGIFNIHSFVWTIVLFSLAGNYVTFGGLIAFEIFCTTVLFILLGYFIDKGNGKMITNIGLLILGLAILFRVFFVNTIPEVIFSDILIAIGMTFYLSSFEVGFYNIAKKTPNTLWFMFFGDLGWDLGAIISLALSAYLFVLGVPLRFIIGLSLFGLFIIYYILKNFYTLKKI